MGVFAGVNPGPGVFAGVHAEPGVFAGVHPGVLAGVFAGVHDIGGFGWKALRDV